MPPELAQAPKETTTWLFFLRSRTHSSCSEVRTAPLMKLATIDLSGLASMSSFLKSIATGQRIISTASTTLRMSSARSTTASSQPPQEAHQ